MTKSRSKKHKQSQSHWLLLQIPKWVAKEWFDDEKYPSEAILGHLSGPITDVKAVKSKKFGTSKLQVVKGPKVEKLSIPRVLNVNCKKEDTRKIFQHGDYGKEIAQTQLIFESADQYAVGNSILASPGFDSSSNSWKSWEKATILSHQANGDLNVQFSNAKKIEIRKRDEIMIPEELEDKLQKCKSLGFVEAVVKCTPDMMDDSYNDFIASRFTKKRSIKRKHIVIQKDNSLKDRLKRRISEWKMKPQKKRKRENRVRQSDGVYRNLVLAAFDNGVFLTQKQLVDSTAEPWSFIKKIVQSMCDYFVSGEHAKEYRLKEEFQTTFDN